MKRVDSKLYLCYDCDIAYGHNVAGNPSAFYVCTASPLAIGAFGYPRNFDQFMVEFALPS